MNALIGYTGFVGGQLARQCHFDELYRSTNIDDIAGKEFDLVVCAGVSAVKWYANSHPEEDEAGIAKLTTPLSTVKAKRFILISTIDIYDSFVPAPMEDVIPDASKQDVYGRNRYALESWVRERFPQALIVRLPALFAAGLKKNFIYDLLNPLPTALRADKWAECMAVLRTEAQKAVQAVYTLGKGGDYYVDRSLPAPLQQAATDALGGIGVSSLNFTDTRSSFPFLDISDLWSHITRGLEEGWTLFNAAVEPLSCGEVMRHCLGVEKENHIAGRQPVMYDMKSVHAEGGYFQNKAEVLDRLSRFLQQEQAKKGGMA